MTLNKRRTLTSSMIDLEMLILHAVIPLQKIHDSFYTTAKASNLGQWQTGSLWKGFSAKGVQCNCNIEYMQFGNISLFKIYFFKAHFHVMYWYRLCITTPRQGSRLLQTGEEKLFLHRNVRWSNDFSVVCFFLTVLTQVKIPIVVVCTKYDLLINELFMDAEEDEEDLSETELEIKAEACFRDRVQDCKELKQAAVVKVSTDKDYSR